MAMPRFFLRLPNPKQRRKGFRIYKDGHPLLDPRLAAINQLLENGSVDLEEAARQAKAILLQVKAKERPENRETTPEPNRDALSRAIKAYEARRMGDKSRRVAVAGLRRCVNLLGALELPTADIQKLQALVDRQEPNAAPKVSVYLNVLLKHSKREERVLVAPQPNPDVLYLTVKEMRTVISHLPEEKKLPPIVAFATGCRLGEVFALRRFGRKASVCVERQLFDTGKYGPPKWTRAGDPPRWAPVIHFGREEVKEWIDTLEQMKEGERLEMRNLEWAEIVRAACRKAFPSRPHKHLSFRDLRHCYAIYWLDLDASIRYVAQAMGNSEAVVKKHYSGFIQTEEAEEAMLALEKEEEE